MKDRIFITLFSIWILICIYKLVSVDYKTEVSDDAYIKETDTVYVLKRDTVYKYIEIDKLIDAIIHVESRHNDSAVNTSSNAVGCLQIRPIMVREVNRIQEKKRRIKRFTNNDRYKRNASISMFNIWRDYHHSEDSYEIIARCWNGGTRGHLISSTDGYWAKVKEFIYNYNGEQ